MRTWIDVASLAKSKTKDGRFVVKSTAGLPFLLAEGDEVAFVPPRTDLPRRARVSFVRQLDDHRGDVAFEGIGPDIARELVGCHCLVRRDAIGADAYEEASELWDGWVVEDEIHGVVGTVAGIIDNPAQALLEVKRDDGEGVVYVPVVDEIVIDVDVEHQQVFTRLPAGLLDLQS